MNDFTVVATKLFNEAMDWLRDHYGQYEFWVERDLVWTVQGQLRQMVRDRGLPYLVLNDYPMLAGSRRALSADLVIRQRGTGATVAAEFKYEPSHQRVEFMAMPGKLPAVVWGFRGPGGLANDLDRIRLFVATGQATAAFAVFIDEGRHFRHRPAYPGSVWQDWPPSSPGAAAPAVLRSSWPEPSGA